VIAAAAWKLICGGLSRPGSKVFAPGATLDAEALCSARSPAEYEQVREDRREAYEHLRTDDVQWKRAFDVQRMLARSGRHRAVGIAELLTAVLAVEHEMTVVHYDSDFEIAAEVLDFDQRWSCHEEPRSRIDLAVCSSWCPVTEPRRRKEKEPARFYGRSMPPVSGRSAGRKATRGSSRTSRRRSASVPV